MTEQIRITPELIAEVKRRTPLVPLIERNVKLRRHGREQFGLCPFHHERTPSFSVTEAKGFYHCFGCGAHGDAIGWVMASRGWSFRDAVEELAADAGLISLAGQPARPVQAPVARPSEQEQQKDTARAVDAAREIWRNAKPADGTPVERYLLARGIRLPVPRSVRFGVLPYWHRAEGENHARNLGRHPVMVACMQGADNSLAAVHLTYLNAEGSGKAELWCPVTGEELPAKKMRAPAWGAGIRFDRPRAHAVIAEGIETTLSVKQALLGTDPELWFVAAGSLGNIAGAGEGHGRKRKTPRPGSPDKLPSIRPDMEKPGIVLPAYVTAVTIVEDGDNGDAEAADALYARAAERFARERRKVRRMRPPAGADFNDVLKGAVA